MLVDLVSDTWTLINRIAMATLTFLSPNTASQARASRIPQHQWELFKTDIIKRYQQEDKDKVARTLQWILQNGLLGFTPRYNPSSIELLARLTLRSRKQLDRQLKVIWQVDKIPELSGPVRPGSESDSQSFESRSQAEVRGDSLFQYHLNSPQLASPYHESFLTESTNPTKRRAYTMGERLGRHKRKRFGTQSNTQPDTYCPPPPVHQEAQDSELVISILQPGGLRIQNPDLHDESLPECDPESSPSTASTSHLPITIDPSLNSDAIIDTTNATLTETQALYPIRAFISPLRLLPILQHIGLSWTTEEADRLITDLHRSGQSTTGTLRLLNIASSFFEAHPINEALFPLFFSMSTLERWNERCFHRIVSCIYSTHTQNDISLLKDLLMDSISDIKSYQSSGLDQFLLHLALIMLYKQHDIDDGCKEQIGKATNIFRGVESFLWCKKEDPQSMQLDITSYSMVHLGFGFLGVGDSRQSINDAHCWGPLLQETLEQNVDHHLEILGDDFLHQVPGPFELVEESMKNPCLRNCLEWCTSRLKAAYRLPATLEILRRQTIHKEWAESVVVYWYLWVEYYNSPDSLNVNAFGIDNTEKVMGIPVAQLLFNMATLMIEISPSEKRYSRLMRRDYNVIQRAIAGAEALERLTDQAFAHRFLSQFTDRDMPFHLPGDLSSSKLHLEAAKTFHSGTKDIFAHLQQPDSFPGDDVPTRHPSLSVTLASSHSSSTFSSMRRLAVGISKHARAPQRPGRSNSRTSALTVDDLSDTLSIFTISSETSHQTNSAWLSRSSL
jgi:hypothetical protein